MILLKDHIQYPVHWFNLPSLENDFKHGIGKFLIQSIYNQRADIESVFILNYGIRVFVNSCGSYSNHRIDIRPLFAHFLRESVLGIKNCNLFAFLSAMSLKDHGRWNRFSWIFIHIVELKSGFYVIYQITLIVFQTNQKVGIGINHSLYCIWSGIYGIPGEDCISQIQRFNHIQNYFCFMIFLVYSSLGKSNSVCWGMQTNDIDARIFSCIISVLAWSCCIDILSISCDYLSFF